MLWEEEEKIEDPNALEAISVAEWKARNWDKRKRSPRQSIPGTCVRVCTDGTHPNAYYCCGNEEGKLFGMRGSKAGRSCIEKHQ